MALGLLGGVMRGLQPLLSRDEAKAIPGPITLDNVTIAYAGHPAIHHISGVFAPGSLTAVLGPNGAGKTSLLKSLAGLKRLTDGHIDFGGMRRNQIGYLPQALEIDRSFPISVRDFVMLGAIGRIGLFRRIDEHAARSAETALAQVGLSGFERRGLSELSTGQFQRVLFARVMVQDTPVILLDEPFNAVDTRTSDDLAQIIRHWHKLGRTIIIVLHDHEFAARLCPSTLIIAREVLAWGPTESVVTAHILGRARAMAEAWDEDAELCRLVPDRIGAA
jgi:zinc/manganese transport system ATP-binding protein